MAFILRKPSSPCQIKKLNLSGLRGALQGRGKDGRSVPQARDQRGERLQLESQIRWTRSPRSQAAEGTGERARQAEELLADAMLDNAALKNLLAKK